MCSLGREWAQSRDSEEGQGGVTAESLLLQPAPWGTVESEICLQCVPVFTPWNQPSRMSPALVWCWQNVNDSSVQDTKERVTLYTSIGKMGGAGVLLQSLTLWRFWQGQRGSPGRQTLERGNLRENIADACLEECRSSPGCTLASPKALKCRSCLDAVTRTRDWLFQTVMCTAIPSWMHPIAPESFQTLVIFNAPLWFICVVKVEN